MVKKCISDQILILSSEDIMRTSQFNMTRAMRQSDEAKETDGNAIGVYLVNKQFEDKKKGLRNMG